MSDNREEFLGFPLPVSESKDLTKAALGQIMKQTQTRITHKNHSKDNLWFTISGHYRNVESACARIENIIFYNPMKIKGPFEVQRN